MPDRAGKPNKTVVLVGKNDYKGGAGLALNSLFQALRDHLSVYKFSYTLRVVDSSTNALGKVSGYPQQEKWLKQSVVKLLLRLSRLFAKFFLEKDGELRTLALVSTGLGKEINCMNPVLVNIHWVGDDSLSVREIGEMKAPVLFTFHDLWPALGSRHFPASSLTRDLSASARAGRPQWLETFLIKHKAWHWTGHFGAICPSKNFADVLSSVELTSGWPKYVLPNPLDLDFWTSKGSESARSELDIQEDHFVILFVSAENIRSKRKGEDLLLKGLAQKASIFRGGRRTVLLAVGGSQKQRTFEWGEYLCLPQVSPTELRQLYSAADVLALPSREDNLPRVAQEAMACALPVVGFNVGGLSDLVQNEENGYLVPPFDTISFAEKLAFLSSEKWTAEKMGQRGREIAVERFSYQSVSEQYEEICRDFLSRVHNT